MSTDSSYCDRYSRNIILKEIGPRGQKKLSNAKVLIIGAGGLGSPAALYCAAAGVGTIGIVDYDKVELSNLQRQILHASAEIGQPKVESARRRLQELNDTLLINSYCEKLYNDNADDIIHGYDFVIDATDTFESKFLINDACVRLSVPFSHAGVLGWQGQTLTVLPGISACYRCVFQEPPPADSVPSCAQAGILGAVAGLLGTVQATEAIKFLTSAGELLSNRMLVCDALTMNFRTIKVRRDIRCSACGSA
jgi:adenylyltransferase/sulfurtransferase